MGLLSGVIGGIGGFATGGLLGGAAGLLGGFLGDEDRGSAVSTVQMRSLTDGEKEMLRVIEEQAPGLMKSLDPESQKQLIAEFSQMYYAEASRQIGKTAGVERGRAKLDLARTGGGPSSIANEQLAEIGQRESDSLSSALFGSKVAGEQVGMGRIASNRASLGSLTDIMNSIRRNQAIGAGSTQTTAGGTLPGAISTVGYAAASPYSYWNQQGGIKMFGGRTPDGSTASDYQNLTT